MMEMMESSVNVTCAEIQISDGFEFRVPADRFTHFHQSDCEQLWYSQFRLDTIFRVRNQTAVTSNSDMKWWISVLIFIVLLGLICFLLRKRFLRCFKRKADHPSAQSSRQQKDDELEDSRRDDHNHTHTHTTDQTRTRRGFRGLGETRRVKEHTRRKQTSCEMTSDEVTRRSRVDKGCYCNGDTRSSKCYR
ncbi:hypothetical protein ROHU_037276 [Labeo rohita]|uniref:Uncharacterized protein n=1 Tax=Labeo rohita TaxID=84645 RepID=A0A498LUL7_LABRO|nr:hypothetical protein ROHU_037276 [Labeo rohita]